MLDLTPDILAHSLDAREQGRQVRRAGLRLPLPLPRLISSQITPNRPCRVSRSRFRNFQLLGCVSRCRIMSCVLAQTALRASSCVQRARSTSSLCSPITPRCTRPSGAVPRLSARSRGFSCSSHSRRPVALSISLDEELREQEYLQNRTAEADYIEGGDEAPDDDVVASWKRSATWEATVRATQRVKEVDRPLGTPSPLAWLCARERRSAPCV